MAGASRRIRTASASPSTPGAATTTPCSSPPSPLPYYPSLPAQPSIDGELVACDDDGAPDFRALQAHALAMPFLCIWAFDLLHLDGRDLRERPLTVRKDMLQRLVHKTDDQALRYSETFDDGVKLLAAAERMGSR